MANNHIYEKMLKITSLGSCKLKQWDATTNLFERSQSKTLIRNAGEDMEQQELSFAAGGNAKWYDHSGGQFGSFLTKLNIFLPYDQAVVLFGIYTNELKTYVHSKTCPWMFTATLFITVKMEATGLPSLGEWINCGTCR